MTRHDPGPPAQLTAVQVQMIADALADPERRIVANLARGYRRRITAEDILAALPDLAARLEADEMDGRP